MSVNQIDNPFLAAMPPLLDKNSFFEKICGKPAIPKDFSHVNVQERQQMISHLAELFVPMEYHYIIYDILLRAIRTTYTTKTMIDSIRQMQAARHDCISCFSTQAQSGSLLGVPGIGKTSTIRRCLSLIPQSITHYEYKGVPFYKKQILYLFVECPADCSIKALAYNIIAAVDRTIGSEYFSIAARQSRLSASALITQVKIICLNHGIGLIVVDELQNLISTAEKNRQVKPLVRFLVELVNETCTSLYFVGTSEADQLFSQHEHLKRRTRGLRLLPLKPDATYRMFLQKIWQYQLFPQKLNLSDAIANRIYDYSGGIPSYIVQIFQEAQSQALICEKRCMEAKDIRRAIELLSLSVPKRFFSGTSLSDFSIPVLNEQPWEKPQYNMAENVLVNRDYANHRGPKVKVRHPQDLLVLQKKLGQFDQFYNALLNNNMAEVLS